MADAWLTLVLQFGEWALPVLVAVASVWRMSDRKRIHADGAGAWKVRLYEPVLAAAMFFVVAASLLFWRQSGAATLAQRALLTLPALRRWLMAPALHAALVAACVTLVLSGSGMVRAAAVPGAVLLTWGYLLLVATVRLTGIRSLLWPMVLTR